MGIMEKKPRVGKGRDQGSIERSKYKMEKKETRRAGQCK